MAGRITQAQRQSMHRGTPTCSGCAQPLTPPRVAAGTPKCASCMALDRAAELGLPGYAGWETTDHG